MRRLRVTNLALGIPIAAVLSAGIGQASDGYTIVHAFSGDLGAPTGGVVRGSDGRLYGTTAHACREGKGSVYTLIPDGAHGYIEKTLACFGPTDPGHTPVAAPVEGPDGALYGTLSEGGAANRGAIFRITPAGALTFPHAFEGNDGGTPLGALVLGSDGLIYGTTSAGGVSDLGTVFRISSSGDFETLHSFSGLDGAEPHAALVEVGGGDFFGTTAWGGANDLGSIFRITKAGDLTTLRSFNSDFYSSVTPLVLVSDGNLYGTVLYGFYYGGLFRITPAGDDFQISVYGLRTQYGLIQGSDAWLYGSTESAVFRWHWTRSLQTVHEFGPFERGASGVIEVGNVVFAGTADRGGPRRGGFVYRVGPYGDNDVLHAFAAGAEGVSPQGDLVEGGDGRFYGVTLEGGEQGQGSLFSVSRHGNLRRLRSFNPADGVAPQAGLTRGPDGALYGTATGGGAGSGGTVFRFDFSGAFELRYEFAPETGTGPSGGLLVEGDGTIYGATLSGGPNNSGNLFRLDPSGTFTSLHEFNSFDFGYGKLIRASDGSLMGTAVIGPDIDSGMVFRWDTLNGFLPLHEFQYPDAEWPHAGLVEVGSGNFYGTTTDAGEFGYGTIYRIDFDGAVEHIHQFALADGHKSFGTLLPAVDGKLYGATAEGGANGLGTIFRSTTGGAFEKLHDFGPIGGGRPRAPLLRGSDGAFYGTESANIGWPDASNGQGAIFRYAAPDLLSVAAVVPDSGPADTETPVLVSGVAFVSGVGVSIGGIDRPVVVDSSEAIETSSATAAPGSLSDLIVENPSGDSARIVGAWFADFLDVPGGHAFHDYVETIVREGITGGCGGGSYCVGSPVTRAQMAVFLLKAEHGAAYIPPVCKGVFGDVPCPSPFADWIEALAAEGVTAGCGFGGYCPAKTVTRAQMAVFLLKTREGATYRPPPAVGLFVDVPPGSFAADWIEALATRGVTGGCNPPPYPLYCPGNPNTRGQMAIFLVRTFGL